MKVTAEKVVLAYSGGLDTSVAIGWIAEQTGAEVIAVAIGVGQPAARAYRARAGQGLRHDQGQGHRLRGGQGPADRPDRAVALLDRPEPVGPRGRDRLPGRHLERPAGGALRLHL